MEIDFEIKYNNPLISNQRNIVDVYKTDLKDIYNSRTFCLYEDIEKLRSVKLALGGSLGTVGIITKHEIVLAITGGLFVLEAVSVIVQVLSYKLTGKRVFKMAPIHHHFEQQGLLESKIVVRFWIIGILLGLFSLSTFKLQ